MAITNREADELPKHGGRVKTLRIWDGRSILYPFMLWKEIMREKPNIVHVQFGPHGEIYGGFFGEVMLVLLLLLRLGGIKTTVTLHSTWIGYQVRERIKSYKTLSSVSFLAVPAFRLYMKLLKWGTTLTQLSTTKIDSSLRKAFLREFGFPPKSVVEIPHPCRQIENIPDRAECKKLLNLNGKIVILIFGYIRKGKGIEFAIQAMKILSDRHPDALLLIAGRPLDKDSENYLDTLITQTKDLLLGDSVRFRTKYIPQDEIRLYFSAADIILFPYSESVGASGPIHNSAGFGRAIVASNEGYHMKEAIGGSLALFRSRSSQSLAHVLDDVLSSKSRRLAMGETNREYANRENWQLAAKRTLDYYRLVLS